MKKFFSFIAAVLFAGSMFAADATMTKGKTNSYDDLTVNGGKAIKLGVSKAGGDMTITVGEGATKMAFFAGAWKGEGAALTITAPEGVTVSPTSVTLKANADFSGSAKSFTVSNPSDYLFEVALTGAENGATFTLTSAKRCIIWGATYGSGAVVKAPSFLPEDGNFIGSVEVSLTADEGSKIFYTLDSSDPTVESTEYTGPFTLTATTLVKAVAAQGDDLSSIVSKRYTLVDTISVDSARTLIDKKDAFAHFVKGVAVGSPFDPSSKFLTDKKICLWMTDEQNPKDSLEAYYIYGPDNEPWESMLAAKDMIGEGDTVLIYANKLTYYAKNKYYEADGGYFVEVLGKYVEKVTYDTLTVTEAKAICDTLGDNGVSETKYYVEGYAVYPDPYDALRGNQIFFMTDNLSKKDSSFEAYLATPKYEGVAYPVLEGDKVRAFGRMKKYKKDANTPAQLELMDPSVEFLEEVEGDRTIVIPTMDTITVARALEIGKALTGSQLVTKEDYCIEGYVSHIQEPYTEQYGNETFWITDTKGDRTMDKNVAFEVYHGKPNTNAEIGLQAKIRIVCKIKNYNGTIENDGQNVPFEVLEQGVPEEVKKVSVEEAVAIGKALATDAETLDRYEITGYVSQIAELYHPDKKTEFFWISDNKGSRAESSEDNAFYVYNGRPDNQQELGLDAKVTIVTTIKNYKGIIENPSALDVEVLEKGSIEADTLSVKEALEKGKELSGKSAEFYVVEGYIASVSYKYDASKGHMSFYMHDKFDKTRGDFQCYSAKVAKKDTAYFKQGSYVRVLGRMENGSHGIQLTQGCRAFTAQAPKLDTTFVTVAKAVEIGNALAVGQETDEYYAVSGYFAYGSVEYDESAGTQTFGISDDEEYDAETSLSIYALNAMIASPGADYGDKVYVVGWISKSKDEDGEFISIENGNAYVNEIPQPTGFEQIELTEKARKVLINGGIYIIRDKKMYNLQGARVK